MILFAFSNNVSHTKHDIISSSGTQYDGLAVSLMALIGYSSIADANELRVPTTFSPYLVIKNIIISQMYYQKFITFILDFESFSSF